MSARFAIAITSIHECFVAIERIRLRVAAGCTERCRRAGVVPIRCFRHVTHGWSAREISAFAPLMPQPRLATLAA
jgi:hypothetical protein